MDTPTATFTLQTTANGILMTPAYGPMPMTLMGNGYYVVK